MGLVTLLISTLLFTSAVTAAPQNDLDDASRILTSIYEECLPSMSYMCLQKKVLVFVDRLDSVRSLDLAQGIQIVKRRDGDDTPITEEDLKTVAEGRAAAQGSEQILHDMLDNRIASFFEHRALRISLPSSLTGARSTSLLDLDLNEDASEGRLKKKKKLKLKALLIGVLLIGGIKLIKLMPVFLALIKLKAIKAIILASISLLITLGGAARGLIQRKLALFSSPSNMKHVKTVEVWLAPTKGGHSSGGGGSDHGHDSYSPSSSYSSGGSGDSYSSSGGSYSDSYSVGGGSYNGGGGGGGGGGYSSGGSGGWSSKSDSGVDLAYRGHQPV